MVSVAPGVMVNAIKTFDKSVVIFKLQHENRWHSSWSQSSGPTKHKSRYQQKMKH